MRQRLKNRNRQWRQRCIATVTLVIVGLGLAGCGQLSTTLTARSTLSPELLTGAANAQQAEQFRALYTQDVQWYECTEHEGFTPERADELQEMGYDLDEVACGVAKAPIDWKDPTNTELIELSFSWLPALGGAPTLGTLFTNPGGPGATGTDFGFDTALSPGFEPVAERYDILGIDPRGVGGSSPIDCSTEYPGDVSKGLAECVAENPLTLTMGTQQVARDFELLRYLMGDPQFHYLGVSYGTMLGATYAQLFPEQLGRMLLDSAENAHWASLTHAFDQMVAISDSTIHLATQCTTDFAEQVEVCPFTDEDSLVALLTQLQQEPWKGKRGATLNGTQMAWYLSSLLYEAPEDQAEALDTLSLALFGDEYAREQLVDFAGGNITNLLQTTITCHSAPKVPDREEFEQRLAEVGLPRMWGGPEASAETLRTLFSDGCDALPNRGDEYVNAYTTEGVAPILVISITGDHATPYVHGRRFADELGNARFVTLEGYGHGASYSDRSRCADDVATAYLLDGVLPPENTVCRDD